MGVSLEFLAKKSMDYNFKYIWEIQASQKEKK